MRIARLFKGLPPEKEGWRKIGECEDEGLRWLVFAGPRGEATASTEQWTPVKVVSAGEAPNKANYHCAWNGRRLADTKCAELMLKNRPGLYLNTRLICEARLGVG